MVVESCSLYKETAKYFLGIELYEKNIGKERKQN